MSLVYTPDSAGLLIGQISRDMSWWRDKFACLGFAVATVWSVKISYKFLHSTYQHFGGIFGLKSRLNSYGKWAVITGCTRGLGREFAKQLAGFGLNLILIARNEGQLIQLAKELESKYNIITVRILVDFSNGRDIYPEIELALQSKDIGILVNNVGVMYSYPQYFHNVQQSMLWDILSVNVGTMQALSHIILNKCFIPKKKGLIVNLSSSAAYRPTPQMASYSASKKFIDYLSLSLDAEMKCLRLKNIQIQSLVPLYLSTDVTSFSPILSTPHFLLNPHAETYVRHALWTFGRTNRTTGFWPHSLQLWLASFVPECAWIWSANKFLSYSKNKQLKRI